MRVAASLSELAAEAWLDTLTARPITSAADADAFEALVRIACAEDALVHTLICVRVSSTESVPMSTVSTVDLNRAKQPCVHTACYAQGRVQGWQRQHFVQRCTVAMPLQP